MKGRALRTISLVVPACERYSPVVDVYRPWDELVQAKSNRDLPLSLGAKVAEKGRLLAK
jgi:hypothetical protein